MRAGPMPYEPITTGLLLPVLVEVHRAQGHRVRRPELEDVADLDDPLDRSGLPHWGQRLAGQHHLQVDELAREVLPGRHRRSDGSPRGWRPTT